MPAGIFESTVSTSPDSNWMPVTLPSSSVMYVRSTDVLAPVSSVLDAVTLPRSCPLLALIVSSAPGSSSPPEMLFLLIVAVIASSVIVAVPFTPSSVIVNSASATLMRYPSGAFSSWSKYEPFSSPFTLVGVSPE